MFKMMILVKKSSLEAFLQISFLITIKKNHKNLTRQNGDSKETTRSR